MIRDKWGLPDPDEGAELLAPAPVVTTVPPETPPDTEVAANRAGGCPCCGTTERASNRAEPDTHPGDALSETLSEAAADPLRGWLEHLRGLVDQAESLEQLRDRMLAAYGDLPTAQLADVMGQAFSVADLAGRFDVAEQSDQLGGA